MFSNPTGDYNLNNCRKHKEQVIRNDLLTNVATSTSRRSEYTIWSKELAYFEALTDNTTIFALI